MLDTTVQDPAVVAPPVTDSPAPPAALSPAPYAVVDPAIPASIDAVPTPTSAPEATGGELPPSPPAVSPEMREYVAALERERAEAREREDMRGLQEAVTSYAQRLQTEQGFTPEQADAIARREGEQATREYRARQFREGQINAAFDIGKQHGVDPRMLMNLPTPQAMEQAAQRVKAQTETQSEVAKLRAELAEVKKKLVPSQTFSAPGVTAQPGSSDYLAALKGKGPLPTAAEIDRYVAQRMAQG